VIDRILTDSKLFDIHTHDNSRLFEPWVQLILVVGLVALGFYAVWLKWGRKER
jgi:hypothetical protein